MTTNRADFGVAEMPMISPEVATLIPYRLARRLCSVPISATTTEITVLTARAEDAETLAQISAVTGRNVIPIEVPLDDIDRLLDYLSGRIDNDDLWLQSRHIAAVSKLADSGLNRGHGDAVRALVERALEFAPYSADLWLTRARVAIHRGEVLEALAVASEIAPHDRRISRWLDALNEMGSDDDDSPAEELTWMPATPMARPGPSTERRLITGPSNRTNLAEQSFRAARDLSEAIDLHAVMFQTAEIVKRITVADSVSVYLHPRVGWKGYSTNPILQARMKDALPKGNRVAAQAMKQGFPVVVADTASRLDDVGPLVAQTSIRSFVVMSIPRLGGIDGLAYVNFDSEDRATSVLEPDMSTAIEVVLGSAVTRAGALERHNAPSADVLDDVTDTYSMFQFQRMLAAELERARRYRFSVSLILLDLDWRTPLAGTPTTVELTRAATAIRRVARASDVIAHAEATVFALMLPQTTSKGAALVAKRLERSVTAQFETVPGTRFVVHVGVSTFPDRGEDVASLIGAARAQLPQSSATRGAPFPFGGQG
jgi:diguanylate cyclase (GGDEF)-like protein